MKQTISIALSVFLMLPLFATARTAGKTGNTGRTGVKPGTRPPVVAPHSKSGTTKSFTGVPLRVMENCGSACAVKATTILTPDFIRSMNRTAERDAAGQVVSNVEAISLNLQRKGMTPKEAREVAEAVVSAKVLSEQGKWDEGTVNVLNDVIGELVNGNITTDSLERAKDAVDRCQLA